jgi:hypothetical protein
MPESPGGRRPWFKFWPSDWLGDPKLKVCSRAARGLWIELCCLMHEGNPYGHFSHQDDALAIALGGDPREIAELVAELERAGVLSRTSEGVIFSRRMVRDEAHRLRGFEDGIKANKPKDPSTPPLHPPPPPVGGPRAEPLTSESSLTSDPAPTSDPVPTTKSKNTPSLRSGVRRASAPGLPGIEPEAPKPARELSERQVDGFTARAVWCRCWLAKYGSAYIGLKDRRSAAIRSAFVQLGRDEAELERLVVAFLEAPPFKHRENPDPVAFLDSLPAIRAGLNGSSSRERLNPQRERQRRGIDELNRWKNTP